MRIHIQPRPLYRAVTAALAVLIAFAATPVSAEALSAKASRRAAAKIERIASGKLPAGETLALTETELGSYLRYDYASRIPPGMRDIDISFLEDEAVVSGWVDLAKVSAGRGASAGYLITMLFGGEQAFEARCRFTSSNGLGQLEVESFRLGERRLEGPMLEYLVNTLAGDQLDGFRLGEPMPLGNNLKQVSIEPGRLVVIAK